ncbi:Splicing factor U2af small subunit A [Wickerhamomyces ciferrii]|uniref:Splicing factor U2af small subunit A n=1 Tax=Wickerhamomyces ciferrii (strain ATCC 14091 / BCRC 22168 / CBS 111 / JCM 3599 / NBRC 0793 / NRRL Y-1031 F-60-10) TaxID=1206466 RepID=K0KJF8_WICCF|nr:Splicing factor U2af small subunit A [Wickerhamomyces ciferrii]CCH45380.1 Splicing factor U2af small subunit A [Wickerhamomyces ciferrii]
MTNLYQNPDVSRDHNNNTNSKTESNELPTIPKDQQEVIKFDDFYKDIFIESSLIGQIDELTVCENHNDHLNGNVYVKFNSEEAATKARDLFSTRWYNSKPIYCELSPVVDFRGSTCRQHDSKTCDRGGMCNFMHVKRPSRDLLKTLKLSQRKYYQEKKSI